MIVYVVAKGLPAWNADFFTNSTTPEGVPGGGVFNAIVGTAEIAAIATAVTVPFGLFCGLFLAESDGKAAGVIRFVADVMTGMPSITIGIFGYIAIVKTTGSYSGFAGAFAIGFIMLPIIIRAGETAIRGVPRHLGEAALALGARRATIARRVVVPTALPGIVTGTLLAIARGLGETAPLLFTIFGSEYLEWNPTQPMAAMPDRHLLGQQPALSRPHPDRMGRGAVVVGGGARAQYRQPVGCGIPPTGEEAMIEPGPRKTTSDLELVAEVPLRRRRTGGRAGHASSAT